MDWNPNRPAILGEEFLPAVANTLPSLRVASLSDAAVQRLDSTVTQTVNELGVFVAMDTAAGSFLAETLLAGSEVPTGFTTTVVFPNEAFDIDGSMTPNTEAPLLTIITQNPVDPLTFAYATTHIGCSLRFATAGLFTGRRILDVRIVLTMSDPSSSGINIRVIETKNDVSVFKRWLDTLGGTPVVGGPTVQEVAGNTGEVRPVTNQPWNPGDVQSLDSAWYFEIDAETVTAVTEKRLYQVRLEVDHCDENRVSADVVTPGATGTRWARFTPHKGDGTANLAKVNGTDLTTVVRQARRGTAQRPSTFPQDFTFSVPYIAGSNNIPPPGLVQYLHPTFGTDGRVVDLGAAAGSRAIGVDWRVSGTGSVDSQTYIRLHPVPTEVGSGTNQQEISGAAAATYGGITLPVRVVDAGTNFTLTVRLKRRSDNAVMATTTVDRNTALLTPAGPGSWRVLQLPFAATTFLAAATQYYLDFSQAGSPGGFILGAFDANSGGPESQPTGIAGYDGTTDVATIGTTDVTTADIAVTIYETIDPPAGFTATGGLFEFGDVSGCGPTGIGRVRLAWTPLVSGVQFAYYEIQRSDDLSDWATIARLPDYLRGTFYDFEARLGLPSCYRLRSANTVGIMSEWTAEHCATAPVAGCGYTFTSNVLNNNLGGLMVAYADTERDASFVDRAVQFPEASEVKRQAIYGRDMFVSFVPPNRRGDEFTRRLDLSGLVGFSAPPPGDAGALRDLSRTALPYVCVRDESGGRWFANVTVPDYTLTNPGAFQHVTVTVGERMALPFAVEV